MRANLAGLVSIGLLAGILGCAREHEKVKAPNPHTTGFAQAGVSLVLGDEWQANDLAAPHSLKPPTLVSDAGVIRVILLPADRTDPEAVADGLRASFDANPKAGKHSFRRQKFVSKTGVPGICVSYLELAERKGRVSEARGYRTAAQRLYSESLALRHNPMVQGRLAKLGKPVEVQPLNCQDDDLTILTTPAAPGEAIGAAGPTTSRRMERFLPALVRAGVAAVMGKGPLSQGAVTELVRHAGKGNGSYPSWQDTLLCFGGDIEGKRDRVAAAVLPPNPGT